MFLFSCEERKNFFLGMSLKSKFPIGILSGLLRFYPFKGIQYKHVCPQRCVCVFYYVRKKTGVRHRVCRLVRNFPDSRKLLNHTAEYLYECVCVCVCVWRETAESRLHNLSKTENMWLSWSLRCRPMLVCVCMCVWSNCTNDMAYLVVRYWTI